MNQRNLCAILIMASIFYFCGCGAPSNKIQMQPPKLEQLISNQILEKVSLEPAWQSEMPLKENEKLTQLYLVEDRLYALSSDNYLISLDTNNGQIIISQKLEQAGLPVFGLNHFNDELYSVIANRLVRFSKDSGELRSKKNFDFGVNCPATRNSQFFYIAGSDRRLHAFKASNMVQVFEAASISDSAVTSIVADEQFVIFSTDAGDLICLTPNRPTQLWTPFKANEGIVSPIVLNSGSVFFASRDTNVYSVDISTGSLNWKFPGGAVYDRGPVVRGNIVYQYAQKSGLTAINRADGKSIWQVPDAIAFLAENRQKSYLFTNSAELIVIDDTTAKILQSVDFSGVCCFVSNTSDAAIYVADNRGRIACLKPLKE